MTTHPTDRVVAYRASASNNLYCAPCGESDTSTALTSDDLPDGGVCVGCGVDVLIPQEVAPPAPDDPRLALLRALNTPPYDTAAGLRGTPLGEAAQLIDAYRAVVLRAVADRYQGFIDAADTGADPRYWSGIHDMTLGLRHMAAEKTEVTT